MHRPRKHVHHGLMDTPEYRAWTGMRRRCHNRRCAEWDNYGGRGIEVCERWDRFLNFLSDMGHRPSPQHSLDRIDMNGHYEPSNCRWATRSEQNQNTRKNRFIIHNGLSLTLSEWSRRTGFSPAVITTRLDSGWSVERTLTDPVRKRSYSKRTDAKAIWYSIISRCHRVKDRGYARYGGRGIEVCQRWRDSYDAFVEDMGPRPSPEHTLDRIDNDGGYNPLNCRWANYTEQANNKRNSFFLTHAGETLTVSQWAVRLGVTKSAILNRLKRGLSEAETLSRPFRAKQT